MKGLLYKDLILIQKYYGKIILLLMALYLAIPLIPGRDASMVLMIGMVWTMLFAMLPVATFSCDHAANWDRYALSAPITRDMVVQEKYLLSGILLAAGSGLSTLYAAVVLEATRLGDAREAALSGLINLFAMALFVLLLQPLIFRFGAERARIVLLVVAVGATSLSGAAGELIRTKPAWVLGLPAGIAAAAAALALLAWLSYRFSCAFYRRTQIG